MIIPIAIFLAFNAGGPGAKGWGTAMSTDTAFALGLLALVGPRFPDRLRSFLLTVAVVDDLVALGVIATAYTEHVKLMGLVAGLLIFGVILIVRATGIRTGLIYLLLGVACWVAMLDSGIDPLVVGLALGLITYAYPAARDDLERASDLFRSFREQPTPELAREAREGVASAISPNERLQLLYHPWTSYVIVPIFAVANAGIPIGGGFLARAFTSPITLGIIVAYLVGKPLGITGITWLVTRFSGGRLRPPVGWASVLGAGTIAGIGFTVSLLVASLAFTGDALPMAKLGVLTAALAAAVITLVLFRLTNLLSPLKRANAILGTAELLVDLAAPVDPERDHIRGPGGRPGDRGRVRRLRVPVLRAGRAGRPHAAGRLRRRPLRVAAPAPQRRPPERPARRRGLGGGRRAAQVLGDARHAARAPGRSQGARSGPVRGNPGARRARLP